MLRGTMWHRYVKTRKAAHLGLPQLVARFLVAGLAELCTVAHFVYTAHPIAPDNDFKLQYWYLSCPSPSVCASAFSIGISYILKLKTDSIPACVLMLVCLDWKLACMHVAHVVRHYTYRGAISAEVNMSAEVVYRGYGPTYHATFNILYSECPHWPGAFQGNRSRWRVGDMWTILTIFSHGAGSCTLNPFEHVPRPHQGCGGVPCSGADL